MAPDLECSNGNDIDKDLEIHENGILPCSPVKCSNAEVLMSNGGKNKESFNTPKKVQVNGTEALESEFNGESSGPKENGLKENGESADGKCELTGSSGNDDVQVPEFGNWPLEQVRLDWQKVQKVGAGLENLGNTCFLNTVIQCLTYCPPLANYLLCNDHSTSCKGYDFCMMCELQKHVKEALERSGSVIKPVHIYENLKSIGDHFQSGKQEDAHEFLRYVIENLRRSSLYANSTAETADPTVKDMTIINHIFGGYNRNQVICLRCKKKSSRYEHSMDIILDIKYNANTLEKALEQFVKPEILEKDNAYQCPKCNDLVPAEKTSTIHFAPNVATIQLKRFDYNKSHGGKITKHVSYPEKLNLRPFMSESEGSPLMYRLNAVLVHAGMNCTSGHYYCYIRNSNGSWYLMDDARVREVALNNVLNQQAYLLFYVRSPADDSLIAEKNGTSMPNGISHKVKNYCQNRGDRRRNTPSPSMDFNGKGRFKNGPRSFAGSNRNYIREKNHHEYSPSRRNPSVFKRPQNGTYSREPSPRGEQHSRGSFRLNGESDSYYRSSPKSFNGRRTNPKKDQSFCHSKKSEDFHQHSSLNGFSHHVENENNTGQLGADHVSQDGDQFPGSERLYQKNNYNDHYQHKNSAQNDLVSRNGVSYLNGCGSQSSGTRSFNDRHRDYQCNDGRNFSSRDSNFSSGSEFREPLLPSPKSSSLCNWNMRRNWKNDRNEQCFQTRNWPQSSQNTYSPTTQHAVQQGSAACDKNEFGHCMGNQVIDRERQFSVNKGVMNPPQTQNDRHLENNMQECQKQAANPPNKVYNCGLQGENRTETMHNQWSSADIPCPSSHPDPLLGSVGQGSQLQYQPQREWGPDQTGYEYHNGCSEYGAYGNGTNYSPAYGGYGYDYQNWGEGYGPYGPDIIYMPVYEIHDKKWNSRCSIQRNCRDSFDGPFACDNVNYGCFGQQRYHPYGSRNPRLAKSF